MCSQVLCYYAIYSNDDQVELLGGVGGGGGGAVGGGRKTLEADTTRMHP